MNSPLTGGSIWRRWDPHVHLPGTLLNNQFGSTTIEQALDALAACSPAIEVLGVTDYFTTASFRRAQGAWTSGSGVGLSYLFPNVELRLNDATARGSGVNLHVLAAPEDVDLLDDMLGRLSFSYRDVEYRADDAGLIALGRAFSESPSLGESAARREGANQFKVSFDPLRTLFQRDARLREHCLVAVAAGSNDGTAGMRSRDGGFAAYRQSLERFADIIFSGSEKQRDFWIGRGVDDAFKIVSTYNALKVCLHGSDAHEVTRLGLPYHDRFSWLKGDARFDTLWQACLAPETRAHIGATNPAAGQHGRISAVTIKGNIWFTPETVPINTGLVAIIGARGSGKTALADVIAVAAGSAQPFDNPASFVARAGSLLRGSAATVSWYKDEATTCGLGPPVAADLGPRRVRYLSQQFVERLCASDGVSDELLIEIERVIFEAWPVVQRQGATDFQELLEIRLSSVRSAQRDQLEAIAEIGEAITGQRVIKSRLTKKREQWVTASRNITTLEGLIKELTGKADSISGDRHSAVSAALATRQRSVQAVDRRITDLTSLQTATLAAKSTHFPVFVQRLQDSHQQTGLTQDQWQAFLPEFGGDVNAILTNALSAAKAELAEIAGVRVDPATAPPLDGVVADELDTRTVAELTVEQARLEKLVGLDKRRAAKLTQLQSQLSAARALVAKLDTEITEGQESDERVQRLIATRSEHYAAYFNALLAQEQQLRELYAPLDEILQEAFGSSVGKLHLSVRRRVDLSEWVRQGEELIDLRTTGPFRGTGGLRPIAEKSLLPVWETGDGTEAAVAIQQFSEEYSASLRAHSPASQGDERAYRDWERGISRWLYNVGNINVTYNLEYEGLNVERLSPGSRGIVLLLLYLAVDQEETDPLIIDQPEENLDPKSVYSELVKLFQAASERRQIIMVTHNANLVVNTDVDQVIVASCDSIEEGKLPRLSYVAGGLEDPGIRQAVCDVLEGGAEAFRERARRLHIDAPSTHSH